MHSQRSLEEENKDACETRQRNINRLKKIPPRQEEKKERSLRSELADKKDDLLKYKDLDYGSIRQSKLRRGATEFKKDLQVSQQQEQQQQQQMQQQAQVALEKYIRNSALGQLQEYKGPKYSIQTTTHEETIDHDAFKELSDKYLDFEKKLRYCITGSEAGTHDSILGSIGYVTPAAAEYLLSHSDHYGSGIALDNLPDGFCLHITAGTRAEYTDYYGNKIWKGEYPRLVLDYKANVKNPHPTPLTYKILEQPERCVIEGSPAQFNVADKGKEFFDQFALRDFYYAHHVKEEDKYLFFNAIAQQKPGFLDAKEEKNPEQAKSILQSMGCYINYLIYHSYNIYDCKSSIFKSSKPFAYPTLADIENNLKAVQEFNKQLNQPNRDNLFLLMRGQNAELANSLIENYEQLFELMDRDDLAGLFTIFNTCGCEGLEKFLEKLQKILTIDYSHTYFNLRESFFRKSLNWAEFIEDDSLETLEEISKLSSTELLWWNKLTSSQAKHIGWTKLSDMFKAFQYFCQSYKKIGQEKVGKDKKITLPKEYSFEDVRNMKVALDRLLVIMSHSRDFEDQAKHLRFQINYFDYYYASVHEKHQLITQGMKVFNHKDSNYYEKYKKDPKHIDLIVTLEELEQYSKVAFPISPLALKYLGPVKFSAPYETYHTAFTNIDSGKYNNLSEKDRNALIFLITVTTTHDRGYKCNIQAELDALAPNLYGDYVFTQNKVFSDAINLFKQPPSWLNLTEILNIIKISLKIDTKQNSFLHKLVLTQKEELTQHLECYDKNKKKIHEKDYVYSLQELAKEEKDEQLQLKLPRVFSLINKDDFRPSHIRELIEALKRFENICGRDEYFQLLDILSILEPEPNSEPPSIREFIASINLFADYRGTNLLKFIDEKLPKSCFYKPENCRTPVDPPLGIETILEGLKSKAQGIGIELLDEKLRNPETKEVNLYYITDTLSDEKPREYKIKEGFIKELQSDKLKESIAKMVFTDSDGKQNEMNKKRLERIILVLLKPELKVNIRDAIEPMRDYAKHVDIFIKTLFVVQNKWPDQITKILERLCGNKNKTTISRSIFYLNDFLAQIALHYPKRPEPFPTDLFEEFVKYEETHEIVKERMALGTILGARQSAKPDSKQISNEHKMLLLKLNLSSAELGANSVELIHYLIKNYNNLKPIFTKIISLIDKQKENRDAVFKSTISLLDLLSDINNPKLTERIIYLLEKNPSAYLGVISKITAIPVPEQKAEALPPKQLNKKELITKIIFQACEAKEFDEKNSIDLIYFLYTRDMDTLHKLSTLLPPPNVTTLLVLKNERKCTEFLADPCNPKYVYRNIAAQFDTSRVLSSIQEVRYLRSGPKFLYSKRRKLLDQMLLVNRYGHDKDLPIFYRKTKGKYDACAAKDLTETELQNLVKKCRETYQKSANITEKENARLIYISLVREAMWRATKKFPYTTQILPLLTSFSNPEKNENLQLEIDTGEGKSMIMAMIAANLWLEGQAVNVCTSTSELSRVAFEEFSPFFDILGIPHSPSIITPYSKVESEYCFDGINYADTASFSIFLAKMKLNRFYLKNHHNKTKFSYALDESDFSFFDDRNHYRFADRKFKNLNLTWVFKPLYELIHSDPFKKMAIGQELDEARKTLIEEAKKLNKDQAFLTQQEFVTKQLTDKQINTWIEAAIAVIDCVETVDFVRKDEIRGSDEDEFKISFARILDKGKICKGSELCHSKQQHLHTLLNKLREINQQSIPEYLVDHETIPIASMTSQNVIEHHLESTGRMIGVTGTAGSQDELNELRETYGVEGYRIPPHRPNKREIEPPILAKGEADHFGKIRDAILRHLRQHDSLLWSSDQPPQPILTAFKDIKKSERFYKYLRGQLNTAPFKRFQQFLHSQLYNANTSDIDGIEGEYKEADIVSNAGVAGCLTASTLIDRGQDIKPRFKQDDTEQNHPDGLFVIQTFIDSERQSRQIIGRAGRLGHPGQAQLIVDQNEIGKRTIESVQNQDAANAKNERIFTARLGQLKNIFFNHYVGLRNDEKYENDALQESWANCLNNMDLEWQRLTEQYRNQIPVLQTHQILEKCTEELIEKACDDWNHMKNQDHQYMPRDLWLRPDDILDEFKKHKLAVATELPTEDPDSAFTLSHQDVSPEMTYYNSFPTDITVAKEDQNDIKTKLKSNKLNAALSCLGHVLNNKISLDDSSLILAFKELVNDYFSGNKERLRKQILQCFAIGEWSQNQFLQSLLFETWIKCFSLFVRETLAKHGITNFDLQEQQSDATQPKLIRNLNALLFCLKDILKNKQDQVKPSSMLSSVVGYVSSYFDKDATLPDTLQNLIELIEQHSFKEKGDLTKALSQATANSSFSNNPYILFNTANREAKYSKDVQFGAVEQAFYERSDSFVI